MLVATHLVAAFYQPKNLHIISLPEKGSVTTKRRHENLNIPQKAEAYRSNWRKI
jgi:hypothetical protein